MTYPDYFGPAIAAFKAGLELLDAEERLKQSQEQIRQIQEELAYAELERRELLSEMGAEEASDA
jgi:hypothetical protein